MIDAREGTLRLAVPALMQKVYMWMTFAMVISAITAYGVVLNPNLLLLVTSHPFIMLALELGLVFGISAYINRLSVTTATLLFCLFAAVNGATLSIIFIAYHIALIGKVFLITAGMFGALSLIGLTTKKDLSRMGLFCFVALIGIIIATLANTFLFKSEGFDMMLSYAGVLIFAGLTAWDSQKIKLMLYESGDTVAGQKIAVLGALILYLDFVNMFLYLLRIFGNRK